MVNIKFTLSGEKGLATFGTRHGSYCIHSQELLLLALLFVLLAAGNLPVFSSCCCDNIGLVLLILLGCELRVSYITVLCVRGFLILSPLIFFAIPIYHIRFLHLLVIILVPHGRYQRVGRLSTYSLCRDGADTPIGLYKQNPSKLPTAEVLSLYMYLALILERFCTQQYSQST